MPKMKFSKLFGERTDRSNVMRAFKRRKMNSNPSDPIVVLDRLPNFKGPVVVGTVDNTSDNMGGNDEIKEKFKKAQALKVKKEQGNAAFASNKLDEAYKLYTEALKIDPLDNETNSKIYFNRGVVNAKKKKYTDAIKDCTRAIKLDRSYYKAITKRATIYMELGNYEDAVKDFQVVYDIYKTDEYKRYLEDAKGKELVFRRVRKLEVKKQEGNAAFQAGKHREADKLYTEALEIDSFNFNENSKIYFNRAIVRAKLKNIKGAIEDCSQAIKLNKNYLKAFLKRAKLYTDTEEYQKAVYDYETVYKMERTREYKNLLENAKLELKKSKRKDYYKILGVSKTASEDEIKKAYRKRAMVHHPDRHSNASEEEKREQEKKFKDVGEAYSVLTDSKKRARYDNGLDLEESGGFGGMGGFDMSDATNIFNFFNLGGMANGRGGHFGGFNFQTGGGGGGQQGFHQFF